MDQQSGAKQKATRDDWKSVSMDAQKSQLPYHREFSKDEYDLISFGLIPETMDDKCFIFLENQDLYFHRSWTGHCIYQLHLELSGNHYSVTETWVNRNPNEYKSLATDDSYEMALLSFMIDNLLLGKSQPFPLPENLPANVSASLYQQVVAGTGYAETVIPTKKSLIEKIKNFFSDH